MITSSPWPTPKECNAWCSVEVPEFDKSQIFDYVFLQTNFQTVQTCNYLIQQKI